jgi:hypothetical protein
MKHFFTLILLSFITYTVSAQTEVNGNQSGTWDIDGSPYLVTGEITVPAGETLNIEPGVTISFQGHYKLTVNGTLTAVGTEQDSIFFTADNSETGWHGIRLTGSQSNSHFAYCHFEYGKTSGSEFPDQHGGAIMMNESDAVIDYCLFTNNEAFAEDNGMGGAIYGLNTTSATQISHCSFINNHTYGEGGAIKFSGDNGADIEYCIFKDNTVLYGGGAICLYGCYDTHIFRSLFTGNVTSYSSGGAVFIEGYCSRIRFVNCTIFDNHATGGDGGGVEIAFSDASFTNSIIYNNPGAYSDNIYLDFGYAEVNYCNTPFPDGAEGGHNINTDAQFVDETSGDFHLQPDSPCVDTGIDFLEITDAYGDTFVVVDLDPSEYYNTAPDMGCYEYDPGVGIQKEEQYVLDIYPNPVKSTFRINLSTTYDKIELIMTDLSGKIVMEQAFDNVKVIDLDSSPLPNGIYMIQLVGNGATGTFKIVKQ